MNDKLYGWFSTGGRVLVAALFLQSGIGKLFGFQATTGFISSAGVPFPELAAAVAIIVELGCGVALLLAYQVRWTALSLAAFTCVATVLFHNFWGAAPAAQILQKIMFMKNVAIIGGLLCIAGAPSAAASKSR
jgi:putative oxidoreductase